ncbi:MAG: flagellar export chaperone FliS [Planctomycetota bacterium]
MSYSPNASREYLKNAVLTANQEQLHLMLLDGAIRYATRGLEALHEKKYEEAFTTLERAQRIVLELSTGLRPENNPALVDRMASLYNFIYRRLIDANMQHEPRAVEDALRILRHQRETWLMLIKKISKEHSDPPEPGGTSPDDATSSDASNPSRFMAEG